MPGLLRQILPLARNYIVEVDIVAEGDPAAVVIGSEVEDALSLTNDLILVSEAVLRKVVGVVRAIETSAMAIASPTSTCVLATTCGMSVSSFHPEIPAIPPSAIFVRKWTDRVPWRMSRLQPLPARLSPRLWRRCPQLLAQPRLALHLRAIRPRHRPRDLEP